MKIPLPTLKRLPLYYTIFSDARDRGTQYVSSYDIADILGVDKTQVRKDIALTGYVGKQKLGYEVKGFIEHLDQLLGVRKEKKTVLIGAGKLGGAIARYTGLNKYGYSLAAVFDSDPAKIGSEMGGTRVRSMEELEAVIKGENIQLAVLTVPGEVAQEVAEKAVKAGVTGIWNFTPTRIKVPPSVALWNQDITASFLTLSVLMRKDSVSTPAGDEGGKQSLYLCMGSGCYQLGSYHVLEVLKELIGYYEVSDKVELKGAFCLGHCSQGITMKYRDQIFTGITKENIRDKFLDEIFPLIK